MKELLFISGLCALFAISAQAQDKDNKSVADTKDGRTDGRIMVVKLDSIVNLDTVSPENYPKPIPMPNALESRPMAVKDISMPLKKLTGQGNVIMPGTELLDKQETNAADYFKQLQPQDSLRNRIRVIPKK